MTAIITREVAAIEATINQYKDFLKRLRKTSKLEKFAGELSDARALYEDTRNKHKGCQFCRITDYHCSKCMWMEYAGKGCTTDDTSYDQLLKALDGVNQQLIITSVKTRIAELRKWAVQERKKK